MTDRDESDDGHGDDLFGYRAGPPPIRLSTADLVLAVTALMQDETWRTARDVATELSARLGTKVSPARVTAILLDAKLWQQRGAVVRRKVYTTVGDQMFDNVYSVHHTQPE